MGFCRYVLEKVPGFDPELAPGAIGLGEDTLFGWQLLEAGYRVQFVPEAVVEHHPDPSRLKRSSWLKMGQVQGRKEAYIRYHWKHENMRAPRVKRLWLGLKLRARRVLQPPAAMDAEGCARWEMSYVGDIAWCDQFCQERKRPRNYVYRGLTKLSQ
jgi:GT2 family glycosyltransferase